MTAGSNESTRAPRDAARRRPPLAYRPRAIGWVVAISGVAILALGLLSVEFTSIPLYHDAFTGSDAPFDAIAGLLLLGLVPPLRDRNPIAWLLSFLTPALTVAIAVLSPNAFSIASAVIALAVVALIYPYRAGFYRVSATDPEGIQVLVLAAALLSLLFGLVGAHLLADDFAPPIEGWSGALYFTVTTISTNGATYVPTNSAAQEFETLLILFGVGTFLTAIVVVFVPFLERRLRSIGARLERTQMEDLNDHVIICGTSAEARATAATLRELAVRTILVAPDERLVEAMRGEGYRAHAGEPSSEEVLRFVGIDRARALVATLDSDAENLLAVITARSLRPGLRIVAVAKQAQSLAKFEKAGANETINPVDVAARLVSTAALERTPV